ncbi:MAG: DUF3293 domain-containing protein [Gemmatimonadaceae bacterium]
MKSTPDQKDPDWPRYAETIVSFATDPPLEIDLRWIPSGAEIAALNAVGFGTPFGIVTAFDPDGRDLSPNENEERMRALDRRLLATGHTFVRANCCSPDRSHCESSVAVVMPQADALDLARELEQVAIFWFDGARFWIFGAIVDTDPMILPRNS